MELPKIEINFFNCSFIIQMLVAVIIGEISSKCVSIRGGGLNSGETETLSRIGLEKILAG